MKIAVFGAGAFGTTLAKHLGSAVQHGSPVHEVTLLTRRSDQAKEINKKPYQYRTMRIVKIAKTEEAFLKAYTLPDSVKARRDKDWSSTNPNPELVIIATPVDAINDAILQIKRLRECPTILIATKGITNSGRLISEDIADVGIDPDMVGAISGPNLSPEMMRGDPFWSVVAFSNLGRAKDIKQAFSHDNALISTSTDVTGTLLCGAMKNVYAIASGICDGLGHGWNVRAILFAKAKKEMARLLRAIGGDIDTLNDIVGDGDLIATLASPESRNFQLGLRLALGLTIEKAIAEIEGVPEGVTTAGGVLRLAARHEIHPEELPIANSIHEVLERRISSEEAYRNLIDLAEKWCNR